MKYSRIVLAILFCLSEFFWADKLALSLNPTENRASQFEFVFLLTFVASIITDRWTPAIGMLAVYLGCIAYGAAQPGGDPHLGQDFHFWLAVYIAGPIAALLSLGISLPITLIRIARKPRLGSKHLESKKPSSTANAPIESAPKQSSPSGLSIAFYAILTVAPTLYFSFYRSATPASPPRPDHGLLRYDNNISVAPTFSSYFTQKADLQVPRIYSSVSWAPADGDENLECPIKVTIDDHDWTSDDLKWETFRDRGAVDFSESTYSGIGPKPNSDVDGYYLFFYSPPANLNIMCRYAPDKSLTRVTITPGAQWYHECNHWQHGIQGSPHPAKDFFVTINQRNLLLPTEEKTLVEVLGPPLSRESLSEPGSWPKSPW